MNIPQELFYTKDHEWIRFEDEIAIIGITDYAQGQLGDIIFIEFPNIHIPFKSGDSVGTIEAVKTVADIFIPFDGEIAQVNNKLEISPESINKKPYTNGWILKVRNYTQNNDRLLSASQYKELIQ